MKRLRKFYTKAGRSKVGFIILGLGSTIWFLARVIPKPQRATYPCMQAAAPFMSALVIYLLSLWGSVASFRQTRKNLLRRSYVLAGLFLLATLSFSILFFTQHSLTVFAKARANPNTNSLTPNTPAGIERGIIPGRVSWIFNPEVAKFDGSTGYWWDDANTIQSESDKMISRSVLDITGEQSEPEAWDALFIYYNSTHHAKDEGYADREKIAIKVNQNNTSSHASSKNINASPQLILSLLKSLVNEGGVPQHCITVFDNSRFITDNIYDRCHAVFPDVVFVDNVGGNGRVKSTYVLNSIHWSRGNKSTFTGIASCAVEADYLINMAILKGHSSQGVTLCGKNWFGATNIYSDYRLNTDAHSFFSADDEGADRYMTFVDFMGHEHLGEKTMLFIVDAIYAQNRVSGVPSLRWKMAPFNNHWPSSVFVSQDGVAIDAVGLDFLRSEWPDMPDLGYSEKYLVEASQAGNPPSSTFYDPEDDGVSCASLGVVETWNSYEKKQYSRNLGGSYGIDLHLVDMMVSVENHRSNALSIYPNPAHTELRIMNCEPDARVQVYSLHGIRQSSSELNDNRLDIGHLPEGLYVLKIEGRDDAAAVRFIKQ